MPGVQAGSVEYQNVAWNRRLAGRWAGVAALVAATILLLAVFLTRNLGVGGKGAVLGLLLVVFSALVGEIHRRYAQMKVWTEGDELVVRNAFSQCRLPLGDVRRGVWHVNRSGGMPISVIKLRLGGRAAEIRVLTVPPAEAAGFAAGLGPRGDGQSRNGEGQVAQPQRDQLPGRQAQLPPDGAGERRQVEPDQEGEEESERGQPQDPAVTPSEKTALGPSGAGERKES